MGFGFWISWHGGDLVDIKSCEASIYAQQLCCSPVSEGSARTAKATNMSLQRQAGIPRQAPQTLAPWAAPRWRSR